MTGVLICSIYILEGVLIYIIYIFFFDRELYGIKCGIFSVHAHSHVEDFMFKPPVSQKDANVKLELLNGSFLILAYI